MILWIISSGVDTRLVFSRVSPSFSYTDRIPVTGGGELEKSHLCGIEDRVDAFQQILVDCQFIYIHAVSPVIVFFGSLLFQQRVP